MVDLLSLLWRAIFSVIILFFLTKLMGFRQISQLSFYDYIIGISIGSIAAVMACDLETDLWATAIPMTVYALISVGLSFCTTKSIKARRVLTGASIVLVQNGQILFKGLRQARYDVNDLLAECRSAGYFNFDDLEFVLMEHTGKLSFLPKAENRPVMPQDLDLQPPQEGLVANLIIDGRVMDAHLKSLGKEERWLKAQLKEQGVTELSEVMLATYDMQEQLHIYPRSSKKPVHVLD